MQYNHSYNCTCWWNKLNIISPRLHKLHFSLRIPIPMVLRCSIPKRKSLMGHVLQHWYRYLSSKWYLVWFHQPRSFDHLLLQFWKPNQCQRSQSIILTNQESWISLRKLHLTSSWKEIQNEEWISWRQRRSYLWWTSRRKTQQFCRLKKSSWWQ